MLFSNKWLDTCRHLIQHSHCEDLSHVGPALFGNAIFYDTLTSKQRSRHFGLFILYVLWLLWKVWDRQNLEAPSKEPWYESSMVWPRGRRENGRHQCQ